MIDCRLAEGRAFGALLAGRPSGLIDEPFGATSAAFGSLELESELEFEFELELEFEFESECECECEFELEPPPEEASEIKLPLAGRPAQEWPLAARSTCAPASSPLLPVRQWLRRRRRLIQRPSGSQLTSTARYGFRRGAGKRGSRWRRPLNGL